jgi:S1-C subfamily serine protease
MPSSSDWEMPIAVQPKPEHYEYDLNEALNSLVGLRAVIPADAFTAETLGTERAGNGVVIRDGVVLTIGYLITEAQTIWLHPAETAPVPGHVLAYDQETGFGLIQALARLDLPTLPLGRSKDTRVGDPVVVAGAGGRKHSVVARIAAKQEFAGNWEYVLDEAIFTAPAHPFWGGTAMIGADGALLGVGSLQVQQARESGTPEPLNMIVPIDILKPILEDLLTLGRPNHPPRPWLGLNAAEIDDKIVVARVSAGGPARRADLRTGDIVLAVAGTKVSDLAAFFRKVWSLGRAGVEVPLSIHRDGRTFEVRVISGDRNRFLKGPSLH